MSFPTKLRAILADLETASENQAAMYGRPINFAPGEARQVLLLALATSETATYLALRAAVQLRNEDVFQRLTSIEASLSRIYNSLRDRKRR